MTFHEGLHCLQRLNQLLETEIHHDLTCYPLKYTMGNPTLIISICMGKSIRVQRVMLTGAYGQKPPPMLNNGLNFYLCSNFVCVSHKGTDAGDIWKSLKSP